MPKNKDNNPPAFPQSDSDYGEGMSLRDYFAGKAVNGLMNRSWDSFNMNDEELIKQWAKSAYLVADAMLEERKNNY